jgi:hypothetical protein
MNGLGIDRWGQIPADSLNKLRGSMAELLPNLVGALVILAIGWVLAKILAAVLRQILARVGLDRAASRFQLSQALRQVGISAAPSAALSRLLFWILMLATVLIAVDALGLSALTSTVDRVIDYLPNVFAAGLILILGLVLARSVQNLARSATSRMGIAQAYRLGDVLNGLVILIIAVLVLEQLGLKTDVLIMMLTVFVGAVGLTMGLALALGARPIITHILAGQFLRQNLPEGRMIEVQGRRGMVERIGPVDTLLKDEQGTWSIPNARLLEETIGR